MPDLGSTENRRAAHYDSFPAASTHEAALPERETPRQRTAALQTAATLSSAASASMQAAADSRPLLWLSSAEREKAWAAV